jgi:uncharacterized protein YndB with AHSA1/START domain
MNMLTTETTMEERKHDDADREIRANRLFDAPRALVWKAFTRPEHLAKWWGPNGFSNTIETMNVKPGGIWKLVMHGPDGRDYKNEMVFKEIVEGEKIAYTHMSTPKFDAVITFASEGDRTRLSWRMIFATAAERNSTAKGWGAIDGLQQTVSRLDAYVTTGIDATTAPFVVTRTFEAPRQLVWAAFTEEKHLAKWWGPKGFLPGHCKIDLRVGGSFHYQLLGPNGAEVWGKWVFETVVAPELMVFISGFSDPAGNPARHPMAPVWPVEMRSRTVFTEAYGRTTVTITWAPINATEAELRAFDEARPSMTNGWAGTMDQLTAYLPKAG